MKLLLKKLPLNVPVAKATDDIHLILSRYTEEDGDTGAWGTYNRAMNHLFGQDCKKDGHFIQFKRGKYGLDAVVKYAEQFFKQPGFPIDLGVLKIKSLIEEANYYMCVSPKTIVAR